MEVKVETMDELQQALDAGADIIMLDEFSDADAKAGIALVARRAKVEISGSVSAETIGQLGKIGPDYVSSGSLTKQVRAVDLSMRVNTSS